MEIKDLKIIDKNDLDNILKDLADLDGHFESLDKVDISRVLSSVRYKLLNL